MNSPRRRLGVRRTWQLLLAFLSSAALILAGVGASTVAVADDPATGTITITKVLDDTERLVSPDYVFTGTWRYCTTGGPQGGGTWSARAGETWTSGPILADAGVCVEEDDSNGTAVPGGSLWTYDVTIEGDTGMVYAGETTRFTVRNWYQPLPKEPQPLWGWFDITKNLIDPDGLADPNAVYSGTYSYPEGFDQQTGGWYPAATGDWSLRAGETSSWFLVPAGATVTLTENVPVAVDGATWSTAVPPPFTVPNSPLTSVSVTNTLTKDAVPEPPTGSISVTKVVDDTQNLADPDFVYTGSWWYCSTGSPAGGGTWSARANETWTFSPVLAGYDVCIDEDSSAYNAAPGGALWDYSVTTPNDISTIRPGETTPFTVRNWYQPLPVEPEDQFAFLEIRKELVDPSGLADPETIYSGTASFDDGVYLGSGRPYSGQDVPWSLAAGESTTLLVPAGALITISENAPAGVDGATWSADLPEPVVIGGWTVAAVTVTNTLTPDVPVDPEPETGTFTITTRVVDPNGVADPDAVYTGTWSYPAGDGYPAGSGTWSAGADETWTSPPVPVGAVVTIAQDTLDPISGATWSTVISDPVTVSQGEPAEAAVTNTLVIDPVDADADASGDPDGAADAGGTADADPTDASADAAANGSSGSGGTTGAAASGSSSASGSSTASATPAPTSSASRGESSTSLATTGTETPVAAIAFAVLLALSGLLVMRRRGAPIR